MVSTFYFNFFYFWRPDNLSPATRYPLPVTLHPPPATRHPRKSPAGRGPLPGSALKTTRGCTNASLFQAPRWWWKAFSNKKCKKRARAGERQASYFRFARFNTFPLYYLRAWHRLHQRLVCYPLPGCGLGRGECNSQPSWKTSRYSVCSFERSVTAQYLCILRWLHNSVGSTWQTTRFVNLWTDKLQSRPIGSHELILDVLITSTKCNVLHIRH